MFQFDEERLTWHDLTFTTTEERLRISFNKFSFDEGYLEIGDGSLYSESTRLTRFNGSTIPSDVISVNNAAWMRISSRCTVKTPEINMTITGMVIGKLNMLDKYYIWVPERLDVCYLT